MQHNATTEAIQRILYKEHSVGSYNRDFIKPFIDNRLDDVLKNYNISKIVDDLAKEKIRKLIN